MLDANLKTQLKGYLERLTMPIELVASLDDSAKSAELKELLQEIASAVGQGDLRRGRRGHAQALLRHRAAPAPTSRSASPASRWAMNSPRWCWRCCRSAATRRKEAQDTIEQREGPRRRLHVRDLFLALVPELPRRGAGAEPDERAEPAHPPHRDRRRAVPGRGREARQIMAVPVDLPERPAVRPGPHEPGADPGQARHRRQRARRREDRGEGRPTTCWSSAAAPPARRRRSMPRARASAPASSPSASAARCWTRWASRTSSRCTHTEGPKLVAALEAAREATTRST